MRKGLIAMVGAVMILASTATPAQAASPGWITSCNFSHSAHDDPIVFFGQPGASHLHEFVGAQNTDAFSTPATMQQGGTTCLTAGDFSGYWIPAGYEDGARLSFGTAKHVLFYYRQKAARGMPVQVYPSGLKMVVGNARAMDPSENLGIARGNITFKCGPGSNTETPYPPARCDSGIMVVVFILPNCWDGVHLDSKDHLSHMAYPTSGRCPASHPVVVPRIQAFWRFDVGTDPIDFEWDSGPYYTAHMDFFDAWDGHLQTLVDRCINAGRDCGQNPSV